MASGSSFVIGRCTVVVLLVLGITLPSTAQQQGREFFIGPTISPLYDHSGTSVNAITEGGAGLSAMSRMDNTFLGIEATLFGYKRDSSESWQTSLRVGLLARVLPWTLDDWIRFGVESGIMVSFADPRSTSDRRESSYFYVPLGVAAHISMGSGDFTIGARGQIDPDRLRLGERYYLVLGYLWRL